MQTRADGEPVVGPQGDYEGNLITVGDSVTATSYGYGTPKGVTRGVVVGFTSHGKVMVHWDGYIYPGTGVGGGYDSSRPSQLRVLKDAWLRC